MYANVIHLHVCMYFMYMYVLTEEVLTIKRSHAYLHSISNVVCAFTCVIVCMLYCACVHTCTVCFSSGILSLL